MWLAIIKGTVVGILGWYIIDILLFDLLPCPTGIEDLISLCMALGIVIFVTTKSFKHGSTE